MYALMNPAVTSAGELDTTLSKVAGYLDTFASTLDGIKPRLEALESEAAEFRARVIDGVEVDASEAKDAGFGDLAKGAVDWVPGVDERQVTVPWYEDSDTVEENRELLERYAGLLEEIESAAATCANDTNALVEGKCVAQVDVTPAEAYTSGQAAMPWGSPRDEERNCPESVGHGGYNFGKGLVQGVGMLTVGYNPETGDFWEGEAYGQAWGGMGDLLGSTLLLASPVGWVAAGRAATGNNDSAFDDWMYDRSKTVIGGWGGLVGYDIQAAENGGNGWHKWGEDAWATGTESVLNVGTFFIPGAGAAGGAAKVGATGARMSRIARLTHGAADFAVPGGSWAVRGGLRMTERLRFFDGFDAGVPTSLAKGAKGAEPPYASVLAAMDDVPAETPTRSTPVSEGIVGRGAESAPESGAPVAHSNDAAPVDQSPAGAGERPPHFDPDQPSRETVGPSQAPEQYGPDDVQAAQDRAPVNDQGQPVDHRTGEPLRGDGPGGERRWHMAYDPATGEWVAQNPGSGHTQAGDLPATGEPNSFGYDADGQRMPYANHRPDYAEGQVSDVWDQSRQRLIGEIDSGRLDLPRPGNDQTWVQVRDDATGPGVVDAGDQGKWRMIEWEPGQSRAGVWDMGHVPDAQYRDLRQAYLNHEISLEDFLDEFRDADNYQVEDPGRNRSHVGEVGDVGTSGTADGSPHTFGADQVTDPPATDAIDDMLTDRGMTREQFDQALLEPVPSDPADLSPEQVALRDIRAELGAPSAGEPMQKVLTPEAYEKYIAGEYQGAQGSVTRLEDGAVMRTPRELYDGLALDYDGSTFSPDADSMHVMRFTSRSDSEISWYSSMGGSGKTDGWTDPYTGNGYTKSTDPVVPESTLPGGSKIERGAEMWSVRKDGTEVLDAVFTGEKWVKVQ